MLDSLNGLEYYNNACMNNYTDRFIRMAIYVCVFMYIYNNKLLRQLCMHACSQTVPKYSKAEAGRLGGPSFEWTIGGSHLVRPADMDALPLPSNFAGDQVKQTKA